MTIEERDKVISTLQWLHNSNFFFESVSTEEDVKYATKLAIKALEQEPGWISISERLPECCGMYIVTRKIYECPDTAPIIISDESWFDGINTWHNDNRINHNRGYLSDVIAWMPLPEPYKPESEE